MLWFRPSIHSLLPPCCSMVPHSNCHASHTTWTKRANNLRHCRNQTHVRRYLSLVGAPFFSCALMIILYKLPSIVSLLGFFRMLRFLRWPEEQ
uniref:Uncharacterized protein n=1 Tax=Picea glauca TaxID=3330 RepID=A0A101M2U1_PICGL|nr:hypothetical protein ABT39_MTgene3115 [Picea glauca]QHR86469.1 hypothetical protein Q903MT_gene469 [Picea sitchensis]